MTKSATVVVLSGLIMTRPGTTYKSIRKRVHEMADKRKHTSVDVANDVLDTLK